MFNSNRAGIGHQQIKTTLPNSYRTILKQIYKESGNFFPGYIYTMQFYKDKLAKTPQ